MIIHSVGDANNTIINGSLSRGLGSTIVIRPQSNSIHKPIIEIDGFTIKNGKGTDIINNTSGDPIDEKVGGGLFVYVNCPKVKNCKFLDNGDTSIDKGGAIFAVSDDDDIDYPDTERDNYIDNQDLEPAEGSLDFSNNTFVGNNAKEAKSVYILGFEGENINFNNSNFDVYGYDNGIVSKYWIKSSVENINLNFANGEGLIPGIEDGDIYVSLEGSNECNGDEACPLLSIDRALSLAIPNQQYPYDILIDPGVYTSNAINSSGEQFPLQTIDYVNLKAPYGAVIESGEDEYTFLLDAEDVEIIDIIDVPVFPSSILQAFYFFEAVTINEYILNGQDTWVASYRCLEWNDQFTECYEVGRCVGVRIFDTSVCGGGICEIPVMGDWGDAYTEGCMQLGEIPLFIIYHPPVCVDPSGACDEDELIELGIGQGHIQGEIGPFINNGIYIIEETLVACTDPFIYNQTLGVCIYYGDVTGDGQVDVLDVVALVNIILTDSEPIEASDITGDGQIDVLDVVALVSIILNS